MRAPCPICEDDRYHELCPHCGYCGEHCVCSEEQTPQPVSQTTLLIGTHCCEASVWRYNESMPEIEGILLLQSVNLTRRWFTRCDARCHNSTGEHCSCLCGGKFHGLGEGTGKFRMALSLHGPGLVARWSGIGVDVSGLVEQLNKHDIAHSEKPKSEGEKQ